MDGSEEASKLQPVCVELEVSEAPLGTTEGGPIDSKETEKPAGQGEAAGKTGLPVTVRSVEEREEDTTIGTGTGGTLENEEASLSHVLIDMSRPRVIEDGKKCGC